MSDETRADQILEECRGLPREAVVARLRREAPRLGLGSRFRLLHELGVYWGEESQSGDGSSLAETEALRSALPDLLRRHQVRSILDIPCGDSHWMTEIDLDGVTYIGADIVESLIESQGRRWTRPGRSFEVLDVTRDPLPRVDMVLCRDLFIHLSHEDVGRALDNFVESGSRLLLTTHYADRVSNPDIESGDFRPVNLCLAPFHLPEPIVGIDERSRMEAGAYRDRTMALWRLDDVRRARSG